MKVGDQLPEFVLPDQDWNKVSSDALIGRPFVLYFYPKDDTMGCTKQACAFRDSFEAFSELGVDVYGVSSDPPETHRAFRDKNALPFTLLSDQKKSLQSQMDVPTNLFGLIPGRVTYIFDADGTLIHKFNSQVRFEKHTEEALSILEANLSNQ